MRKVIGVALAAVLVAPMALEAQARREYGVDLVVGFQKPDGGDGSIVAGTPIDVRVGLMGSGNLSFEPRFSLWFDSKGGIDSNGDATTAYAFSPGVNVLFRMGQGGTQNSNRYFTVGAAIDLMDFGAASASQISINGGIGMRRPMGSGATRIEAFVRYDLENSGDGLPSIITVGARLGVSFFQ
jgi:hypothetical protein